MMRHGRLNDPDPSGLDLLAPLTATERWDYLLGSSLFFLLGTLAVDSLLFAVIIPEVLFVAGWVYLAGAASEDRPSWALFLGSTFVGAAALVGFAAVVLPADPLSWVIGLILVAPYVPVVFAPIVTAHAVLIPYVAMRLAGRHRRPSATVVTGSIVLVFVAIAALVSEASEPATPAVFFVPVGYALITLGVWRGSRVRYVPEHGLSS